MLKGLSVFPLMASVFLSAHNTTQTAATAAGDAQAVSLASPAGGCISDVALNANAGWIAGSITASGAATLKAKRTTEARLDLTLGGISPSEVRNDANGPAVQVAFAKPFLPHAVLEIAQQGERACPLQ